MHLKIDFVNTDFFLSLSLPPWWQGFNVTGWELGCDEGKQTILFSLKGQTHFQSLSYISPRQLLVVGKEFVGDVWWNFFHLQPESHSASLQNLIGQLWFQRDDWRREAKLRVQVQCCNYLLITEEKKRGKEITGGMNGRKAGDAKAGKIFLDGKKEEILKVQREIRTKRNDSKKKEKSVEEWKSRSVRGRLKRQQGTYLREDRLKWTKRDYEQPGESARGTYLDVWCHSWARASLSTLKWEETMDSSPAAMGRTCCTPLASSQASPIRALWPWAREIISIYRQGR